MRGFGFSKFTPNQIPKGGFEELLKFKAGGEEEYCEEEEEGVLCMSYMRHQVYFFRYVLYIFKKK